MTMRPKCDSCDYLRCVRTLQECGLGAARKSAVLKRMREATVCVSPESAHYGENRRNDTTPCGRYADWFRRFDFGGDAEAARAEQARLVDEYRRKRLRLETPYTENGGAGGAPMGVMSCGKCCPERR